MPAPSVFFDLFAMHFFSVAGNVHLTTDNGFYGSFRLGILCFNIIMKLFHSKHATVIRQGYGRHFICNGFVDQVLYRGLSIEDGILRMHV